MMNFNADSIKEMLKNLSIYDVEPNMDAIVDHFENDLQTGDLKSFLKILGAHDNHIKTKDDLIEHLKNTITIDGIAYSGKATQQKTAAASTTEKSEPTLNSVENTPEKAADPVENTLESAQSIVDSNKIIDSGDTDLYFDPSTDNEIYIGRSVSIDDKISLTSQIELNTDFCAVVNKQGKVVLTGKFIKKENEYTILSSKNQIDYDEFKNRSSYKLISQSADTKEFYSTDIDIISKSIEKTDKILCIDFGTSNTVMGIYDADHIMLAEYPDVTTTDHRSSNIYPTIVYVKKCDPESGKIEYLYGFEAKKVLIDSDYNPKGTMFFEIKRWITSLKNKETLIDEEGNVLEVERREILAGYLQKLISIAQSYFKVSFKKVHFSAPIQLKNKFIDFLQKYVFANTDIEVMNAGEAIDEGVSIIYKHISDTIKQMDQEGKSSESKKVLIVDCGGGTTDLASCSYDVKKTDTGYDLRIITTSKNGNSNFGGNNITYRIFQLLKIKLTEYFISGEDCDKLGLSVSDILNFNDNDIFSTIEECVKDQKKLPIYDNLDRESARCEEILPTDFKFAKNKNTKSSTRRNFNYLWQLAEKIKIEFFNRSDLVSIDFSKMSDKNIVVSSDENFYFYIKNEKDKIPPLVKTVGIPAIEINTKEITALLKPEIYYLLSTIFRVNSKVEIKPDNFDIIKFSGQSCKISLFQELLKEFVAGKKLRTASSGSSMIKDSAALKLECIEGSICYIRDKQNHMINPCIESEMPNLTYSVSTSRGEGLKDNILINGQEFDPENKIARSLGVDRHKVQTGDVTVKVTNTIGEKREYSFSEKINSKVKNSITLPELEKIIKQNSYIDEIHDADKETQTLLDKLIEDIKEKSSCEDKSGILVFAVPNNDGFGFMLYQLLFKLNDSVKEFYLTDSNVHMFEDNVSTKTFFSGDNCTDYMK